jgi:hypothetical protein
MRSRACSFVNRSDMSPPCANAGGADPGMTPAARLDPGHPLNCCSPRLEARRDEAGAGDQSDRLRPALVDLRVVVVQPEPHREGAGPDVPERLQVRAGLVLVQEALIGPGER